MRKAFPGFYKPTIEEFNKMWKEGIFIFDTNVLLDLYRYSDDTVTDLLSTIEKLKARIWIPYRVAFEYHRRLNDIVKEQVNSYTEAVKTLESFNKSFKQKRGHPFLQIDLQTEIEEFCKKINEKLKEKEQVIKQLINDNPIKDRLADLIENNVGTSFSSEELDKIFAEGGKRYSERIPPGYKDKGTKPGNEVYGDLIIWKEILNKAKLSNLPLIFVTGDVKEDWFQEIMGMTVGPRPELVAEIKKVNDILFYMYPIDSFLRYANEKPEYEIKETTLKEIEGIVKESQLAKENVNDFENLSSVDCIDNEESSNAVEQERAPLDPVFGDIDDLTNVQGDIE